MKGNQFEYTLGNLSFAFLLLSMLFYWFQASFEFGDPISSDGTISLPSNHKSNKKIFLKKFPSLTMWSANIALASMLLIRWFESGHFPLSNLYESLLFLSWSFTTIHFFLEYAFHQEKIDIPALGAVTSPIALFTNAFATFSLPQEMQKSTVLVPALQSNWLMMHVSVMMVSYAALLSGSLLAMAFLVIQVVNQLSATNAQVFQNTDREINKTYAEPHRRTTTNNPLFLFNSFLLTRCARPIIQVVSASVTTLLSAFRSISMQFINTSSISCFAISEADSINCKDISMSENVNFSAPTVQNKEAPHPVQLMSCTKGAQNMVATSVPRRVASQSLRAEESIATTLLTPPHNKATVRYASQSAQWQKADSGSISYVDKIDQKKSSTELGPTLDNLSYRSIGLGFALLTIGILSGAVWANEAWGSYWSWDPKETWAFVTWLIFAFYLHTRLSRGWTGKKSAFVATFGFLIVWFCYLGVNLFGKGLHSYGWFS